MELAEFLCTLGRNQRVLDLGCQRGSFPKTATPAQVIRLDLDRPVCADGDIVQGDAAHLPFGDRSIDMVIANHSLEHFEEVERSLSEVGRVIKPEGALYVAVPDATTLADRVYRWLGRGGGHVNLFASVEAVSELVTQRSALRYRGAHVLCSGYSFLNRKNARPGAMPRRLYLLGGARMAPSLDDFRLPKN